MSSPNNVDVADAQGSRSHHNTSSGSWHMPSNPCPSIDKTASREENKDPTYDPTEEVQFKKFNEGLQTI